MALVSYSWKSRRFLEGMVGRVEGEDKWTSQALVCRAYYGAIVGHRSTDNVTKRKRRDDAKTFASMLEG